MNIYTLNISVCKKAAATTILISFDKNKKDKVRKVLNVQRGRRAVVALFAVVPQSFCWKPEQPLLCPSRRRRLDGVQTWSFVGSCHSSARSGLLGSRPLEVPDLFD